MSEPTLPPTVPTTPTAQATAAPEPTVVPGVAAALEKLASAEGLDPADQVAVYEAVHRALQDALADVAEDPGEKASG